MEGNENMGSENGSERIESDAVADRADASQTLSQDSWSNNDNISSIDKSKTDDSMNKLGFPSGNDLLQGMSAERSSGGRAAKESAIEAGGTSNSRDIDKSSGEGASRVSGDLVNSDSNHSDKAIPTGDTKSNPNGKDTAGEDASGGEAAQAKSVNEDTSKTETQSDRSDASQVGKPGGGHGQISDKGPRPDGSQIANSGARPDGSQIANSGARPDGSQIASSGARPDGSQIASSGARPAAAR